MSILEIVIISAIFLIGALILTIMIVKHKRKKKQPEKDEDLYE